MDLFLSCIAFLGRSRLEHCLRSFQSTLKIIQMNQLYNLVMSELYIYQIKNMCIKRGEVTVDGRNELISSFSRSKCTINAVHQLWKFFE